MAAPANLLLAAAWQGLCEVLPDGWSLRSPDMAGRLTPDGWLRVLRMPDGFWVYRLGRDEVGGFGSMRDAIAAVELAYCGCRVRR